MPTNVVNGDRWIAERLAFLRELLEQDDLADADRQRIEDEIAVLSKERGIIFGGFRLPRFARWFRRRTP